MYIYMYMYIVYTYIHKFCSVLYTSSNKNRHFNTHYIIMYMYSTMRIYAPYRQSLQKWVKYNIHVNGILHFTKQNASNYMCIQGMRMCIHVYREGVCVYMYTGKAYVYTCIQGRHGGESVLTEVCLVLREEKS